MVEAPHFEQMTAVSIRPRVCDRFALHVLQCLGSFRNCFSLKKSCSPALKTKSSPQSTHFIVLSVNSMLHLFTGTDEVLKECLTCSVDFSSEDLQDIATESRILSRQLVEIVAGYSANLRVA